MGDHAVTTSRVEESGSGGGMTRGITGSRASLRTTVSGAASVADEVTAGEASIPLVTTDIFPVPTEGRGVVTSRNGDPVVDWALEVVGR